MVSTFYEGVSACVGCKRRVCTSVIFVLGLKHLLTDRCMVL